MVAIAGSHATGGKGTTAREGTIAALATRTVQSWAFIQLVRRLSVFPPSILRVMNDSAGVASFPPNDLLNSLNSLDSFLGVSASAMLRDAITAFTHALIVVSLLPRVLAARPTRLSAAALTACAMYYYNPLNLVSALDGLGWHGAVVNAAVLLLAWVALGRNHDNAETTQRAAHRLSINPSLLVHLVPSVALLVDCALHPPSPTLRPSLSLRWYLNAEVFPSFRSYFSTGISVMGALLSCSVALGCVGVDTREGRGETTTTTTSPGGVGGGRRGKQDNKSNSKKKKKKENKNTTTTNHQQPFNVTMVALLAIQGMLWELFATSSGPAVSALWQACVVGMAASPSQVIRTQQYVGLYLVATVMNVAAYQLWIGDNVGNANFFYGMNMLRGAGVCVWVYSLIKDVRRRVDDGDGDDGDGDDDGDDDDDGGDDKGIDHKKLL